MVTSVSHPSDAIIIAGPTASGKTELAIRVSEILGGEIINADSMQVYQGMNIGTAKPTLPERNRVPFHLLDVVPPDAAYTVSLWREQATCATKEITARGKVPVICGGTGFYIRSLLRNPALAETGRSDEIRLELTAQVETEGKLALHNRLQQVDPVSAARLHPNDVLRVIRAMEVYLLTGVPLSEHHKHDRENTSKPGDVRGLQFVLNRERLELYERIERRVDSMMAVGLVDEVRNLIAAGYADTLAPLNSLGYKEVCRYLAESATVEQTVDEIKMNTRRYAKRQLTWFRAEPEARWINVSTIPLDAAAEHIAREWVAFHSQQA